MAGLWKKLRPKLVLPLNMFGPAPEPPGELTEPPPAPPGQPPDELSELAAACRQPRPRRPPRQDRRTPFRDVTTPGRDRPSPEGGEPVYSAEDMEWMEAVQKFKHDTGRQFPTLCELLLILKSLGYCKPPSEPETDPRGGNGKNPHP
jgi:hypothetical protein